MEGDRAEVLSLLAVFACGAVASAGGIGGGGVIVPVLLAFGEHSYHKCTVLSLCAVLGNYVAQTLINWPKPHPFVPRRPLINWDLVLILLPAQLGGSNIGVLVGKASPDTIMLSIAAAVMVFAIGKTWVKWLKFWRQEQSREASASTYKSLLHYADRIEEDCGPVARRDGGGVHQYGCNSFISALASAHAAQAPRDTFTASMDSAAHVSPFVGSKLLSSQSLRQDSSSLGPATYAYSEDFPSTHALRATMGSAQLLDDASEADSDAPGAATATVQAEPEPEGSALPPRELPHWTLGALAAVWALYVLAFAVSALAVPACSTGSFTLLGSIYPPLLLFLFCAVRHVSEKQMMDPCTHLVRGDVDVASNPVLPVAAAFGVGILCTLLGIGGGELMGPLLLAMGVLPPVSTATVATMSLLNTANNVVHYALLGDIPPELGLVLFVVGSLAGALGRSTALLVVRRWKRSSVLVAALLVALLTSLGLLILALATDDLDLRTHAAC